MEVIKDQVTANKDWTTPHLPSWRSWYGPFTGKPNARGLEIGCAAGLTSEWLCRNILTGEGAGLDCVDAWRNNALDEAAFDERIRRLPIEKIKEQSIDALPRLRVEGRRYDFVYVDGSHHGENVLFDLVLGWSMLTPGGVIVADDYHWTNRRCRIPVRVAVDGWLACVFDSMRGYEHSRSDQIAVWRR